MPHFHMIGLTAWRSTAPPRTEGWRETASACHVAGTPPQSQPAALSFVSFGLTAFPFAQKNFVNSVAGWRKQR
jgi:hypothetical protein